MKLVLIDFDIEGFHNYPESPKEVEFLKYPHRHLFQIKMGFEVTDSNREIEIFIMTDVVKEYINSKYGTPAQFQNMSCEHIAEDLLNKFNSKFVEVLEDSKGGARVEQ